MGMTPTFESKMCDETNPEDPSRGEVAATPTIADTPACGRIQDLAGDVMGEVTRACPRCTGGGTACLIDLMYAEAFPNHHRH